MSTSGEKAAAWSSAGELGLFRATPEQNLAANARDWEHWVKPVIPKYEDFEQMKAELSKLDFERLHRIRW